MPLSHRIKVSFFILLWLIIVFKTSIFISLPITLFGLWVLYVVYPRFDLTPSISLKSRDKLIALTFDDGPTPNFTENIVELLKDRGITATFFMIGNKMGKYPELAKKVLLHGNDIGVHTYAHKKLHLSNYDEIDKEISRTRDLVQELYKEANKEKDPVCMFRAPHGFKSFTLKRYLRDKGLSLIPWTRGVWDTAAPGPEQIFIRATRNPANTEILLLHDGKGMSDNVLQEQKEGVMNALPKIIDFYKNNGYTFVKVSAFIKGDKNKGGSSK